MGIIKKLLLIKEKKPQLPATQEELDQLELEVKKSELLARKRKADEQSQKPSHGIRETMEKVLGKPTHDIFDVRSKSDYNPW